jgi:hypothetical protein
MTVPCSVGRLIQDDLWPLCDALISILPFTLVYFIQGPYPTYNHAVCTLLDSSHHAYDFAPD